INVNILQGNDVNQGFFQPLSVVNYLSDSGETQSVAVGDFNGDGKPDFVVTSRLDDAGNGGPDSVDAFLGLGSGSFSGLNKFGVATLGVKPVAVAVGDFNGDGKLDLAVVNRDGINQGTGNVTILL